MAGDLNSPYKLALWAELTTLAQNTLSSKLAMVPASLKMGPILHRLSLSEVEEVEAIIALDSQCDYMVFDDDKPNPLAGLQASHLETFGPEVWIEIEASCKWIVSRFCELGGVLKT